MLSIAEVKRRLCVGTEYTGEFVGNMNTHVIGNGTITNLVKPESERITRRRVVKQGSKMVSLILSGPKMDQEIDLSWPLTVAREDTDGNIVLTSIAVVPFKDFLKIREIEYSGKIQSR